MDNKGLYQKYIISKTNGKPLADGFYAIVLRIDGGKYVDACRAGVAAFAKAVEKENQELAIDIKARLNAYKMMEDLHKLGKEMKEYEEQQGYQGWMRYG